ncbi:carboxymuconolactone decarboxylase family protein [Actinocrispum wychmicini]|uniref:AhpD family alkylhydroperoxidase n=1 Tax=Actinocrispum wychmicini TaxID=1213861 RepID=A0A4R2JDP9_9PSEU|nr:carboxymuconolactone decarboxylase family protein [Actinocrispum wychmicini]TCO54918.1 AhpD family alkylhydroperoxidase [Actinocrispum wychmicini]
MTKRINIYGFAKASKALFALAEEVTQAGNAAGVDQSLFELVKIRASQINGCALCLDMHTTDALKLGENARRIFLLDAWRETDLFTEQERAALELTEVLTRLPDNQDVPDDVYDRAVNVFTEDQYRAVVWMVMVINGYNRIGVPSRSELPRRAA